MFAKMTMLAMMGLVMVIVSSEVYALLGAINFIAGKKGTLMWKLRVGFARYQWASLVCHEFFMDSVGKPAAYSVVVPMAIWAGMVGLGLIAHAMGSAVPPEMLFGSSMLTAGAFFTYAYGSNFLSARADVREQSLAGSWKIA